MTFLRSTIPLASWPDLLYWPGRAGICPRAALMVTALDDIPALAASSDAGQTSTPTTTGNPDVDHLRPQGRSHQELCDQNWRYRFAGGAGRDPFGAHQRPHRAFQGSRQGQPFPTWIAQARVAAAPATRLSRPNRQSALQIVDRATGNSSLSICARCISRVIGRTPRLSALHPAVRPLSIWKDGSNGRPFVQRKVEGHGRIAGCCFGSWRYRREWRRL